MKDEGLGFARLISHDMATNCLVRAGLCGFDCDAWQKKIPRAGYFAMPR